MSADTGCVQRIRDQRVTTTRTPASCSVVLMVTVLLLPHTPPIHRLQVVDAEREVRIHLRQLRRHGAARALDAHCWGRWPLVSSGLAHLNDTDPPVPPVISFAVSKSPFLVDLPPRIPGIPPPLPRSPRVAMVPSAWPLPSRSAGVL